MTGGAARLTVLTVLMLLAAGAALTIGRYPLPVIEILRFLAAAAGLLDLPPRDYATLYNLIVDIRLPRVLTACLVGAALAVSGSAFQAVFRNPLVSPGVLGVLAGATFGAALGMLVGGSWLTVQVLAFVLGLTAVGLGVGIAALFGTTSLVMLVLGGMISSALFTALLSLVKYVADPYNLLPAIVFWLMGSLANADLHNVAWVTPLVLVSIVIMTALGRAMDAMTMGDDEARALGVPVTAVRYGIIGLATLISAVTVSLAGMIGWIGLIVPHFARAVTGPANGLLMPASALLGAIFLLAADALARTLGTTEVPIGIITELMGIPAFLVVLARARRSWN